VKKSMYINRVNRVDSSIINKRLLNDIYRSSQQHELRRFEDAK
jgi:hypothetical protein